MKVVRPFSPKKSLGSQISRIAFSAMFVLVSILWGFSYSSYGLVGREAYSGIGTELMSVRGKLIFWRYNSYHGWPPPQSRVLTTFAPTSRTGHRMEAEYDLSRAPKVWQRAGFVYFDSDSSFGPNSRNLLLSVPYWFLAFLLAVPYPVAITRRIARWFSLRNDRTKNA